MSEKFEGGIPSQEGKEKLTVSYQQLPNRSLESAENLSGFEGFSKVDGVVAKTEEEAKEYLSKIGPDQILWKEETGEIWEGHEYLGMGSPALGREKNGLKLIVRVPVG